jgi:hypothetical protein
MSKINESYYIAYDDQKVYWFIPKSLADKRNLTAIAKKKHFSKDLLVKEFDLNIDSLKQIKHYLLISHKKVISLLNTQKENAKNVKLPIWIPFNT